MRETIYRRIAEDLRRRILSGGLPRGARLPSTRELARQLGVSRNTVLTAYETLAAEGLVDARIGSGTRVRGPLRKRLDPMQLLREAHYPADPVHFRDPDGNPIYFHR